MVDQPRASEPNGQLPALNDANIGTLLSPPSDISIRLSNSAKTYKSVIANATSILTKSSVDLDAFRSVDPEDKTSGMRETIITIKTDFTRFADRETDLCKNLIAYGELLKTLVSKVDTSVLSAALGGRIEAFRKAVDEDSHDRATRAAKVLSNIDTLLDRLDAASTAMEKLGEQAAAMEAELRRQNVGHRLVEALKKLFHLDEDEDSALVQISVILGITIEYLRGDFEGLSKNKKEMQAFIDNVNALQAGLAKVRTSMLAMATGMKSSVEANAALIGVWDYLSNGMAVIKGQAKAPVSKEDQDTVMTNWQQAKLAANEAIAAITGGTNAVLASMMLPAVATDAPASPIPFPKSHAEVQLFKLASDSGVDNMIVKPENFRTLSYLVTMPEIMEKHSLRFSRIATASFDESEDDEKRKQAEELMRNLGPPALETVKAQLEGLSGDCKQVTNTFSTILEIPFLQNLSILNPFKNADTPSEPTDLNMREVVTRYKDKYVELQDETKTTAKSLISYSAIQLALLPRVEMDPSVVLKPGDGKISVDTYYKACFNAISDYTTKATELRTKHSYFLSQWTQAQTNITQRIAECRDTAKNLRDRIQEKKDEYKHKTIVGVLEILGGIGCFALGFIVPFLAPVAWGAGVALIGIGIKELIDRGILDDAIAELTGKFNAATDAANGLETLKSPFAVVGTKIQNLVGIWDHIEQALLNIQTNVSTLKDMPSGVIESLWSALLTQNTQNWTDVKDRVTEYVEAIR